MKNKYSIIIIPPGHDKAPVQIQFSIKAKKIIVVSSAAFGIIFSGLLVHDVYQSHYINYYTEKIAYVEQLEDQLHTKDMEIGRLNKKSEEINDNLLSIASLETKISSILKINKISNTASTEVSRGSVSVQSLSTPESLDQAAALVESQKQTVEEQYNSVVQYQDKIDHTPSILPVEGPFSSDFGYRRNPFGGYSSEFHSGLDIACAYGSPVKVTADGIVTFSGYDGYWGRRVQVDHGYGIVTFYGHNSKLLVNVGDHVTKGEIIAYSGNSGRSTGSHLHYQAYIDGKLIDPLYFTTNSEEQ